MFKKKTIIFDNPNVTYAHGDFDADVLFPEDIKTLADWAHELGVGEERGDPIKAYKEVSKAKKNKFKRINQYELKYFNRCSWLSLKRKGHLLMQSFVEQFVPKIERVISVQKHSQIVSDDKEDVITGKIDMILKIKGYDKPIIFDLKTASRPYTQKQIDETEQLAVYSAMEGGRYGTDLVGYVVLSKAVNKETEATCKNCSYKRTGRHKKCDNEVMNDEGTGKVRCNGDWDEKTVLAPQVQVLIEKKTDEQINYQLGVETQTIDAMKAGVVYKNTSKCDNWYGSKCPFYDLCHKNDATGLIKRN